LNVEIKIGRETYGVKSLTELNIKDYFDVLNLIRSLNDDKGLQSILSMITTIPKDKISLLSLDSFSIEELESMLVVNTDLHPLKPRYGSYVLTEFGKMMIKPYMDCDKILQSNQDENVKIAGVVTLLLMNSGNYSEKQFNVAYEDVYASFNVMDALTIFNSFTEWKISLIKHYEGLFTVKEGKDEKEDKHPIDQAENTDDDNENDDDGWGFDGVIMDMSDGDILKRRKIERTITIIDFFEWLSYEKYKADREKAKDDERNRRNAVR